MMRRRMMKGHISKNFPTKDILTYNVKNHVFACILFPAGFDPDICAED